MLAKIRARFFRHRIFHSFAAIIMASRRIEFASAAAMQIRAAFRTGRFPKNVLGKVNLFSAVPTHVFYCKHLTNFIQVLTMEIMFQQNKCQKEGCEKMALTVFNYYGEIAEGENFCFEHLPNPEKTREDVFNYINQHQKIIGLNASGITFENIDLTDKRFYGCNFQHCKFVNLNSTKFRSRMSIFDHSFFIDCSMLQCNMQFTSFGGCVFSHILFTGSDIIHDSFCGAQAYQSSFDDSDLYNSRFINTKLIDTSFRNCNIKNTMFVNIEQKNILFKASNLREAIFDERGRELFLDNSK